MHAMTAQVMMPMSMDLDDCYDELLFQLALDRAERQESSDIDQAIAADIDARTKHALATGWPDNHLSPRPSFGTAAAPRPRLLRRFVHFVLGLFGWRRPAPPEPEVRPTGRRVYLGATRRVPDHDAAWKAAFDEQALRPIYAMAAKVARFYAAQVGRASGVVDDDYVYDLVQGAIAETYMDKLVWNPKVPLRMHICAAIRSRARHERNRSWRRVGLETDDHTGDLQPRGMAALSGEDARENAEAQDFAKKAFAALRALAVKKHDDDAVAVLDAHIEGHFEREDVMERTGLSEREYRRAKDRLGTYHKKLPAELQPTKRRS